MQEESHFKIRFDSSESQPTHKKLSHDSATGDRDFRLK